MVLLTFFRQYSRASGSFMPIFSTLKYICEWRECRTGYNTILQNTNWNFRKHNRPTAVDQNIHPCQLICLFQQKNHSFGPVLHTNVNLKGKNSLPSSSCKIILICIQSTNQTNHVLLPHLVCIYSVPLLLISFPAASTNYAQHQIHMHIFFTWKGKLVAVIQYSIHPCTPKWKLGRQKNFHSGDSPMKIQIRNFPGSWYSRSLNLAMGAPDMPKLTLVNHSAWTRSPAFL